MVLGARQQLRDEWLKGPAHVLQPSFRDHLAIRHGLNVVYCGEC